MQVNLLLMLHEDELRFCITLIKHVWFLLDQKQIHSYIKIITEKTVSLFQLQLKAGLGTRSFAHRSSLFHSFYLLLKIAHLNSDH